MTGHAWPLTHDDAKTRGRKTNCTNTDTLPIRAQRARPVKKRELTNLLREDRRGQLRLSLTNTYHEWPVINAYAETGPKRGKPAAILGGSSAIRGLIFPNQPRK